MAGTRVAQGRAFRTLSYTHIYEYYSDDLSRPISTRISPRERRLRNAAALHHSGQPRVAQQRLFLLARREAETVTRALGLDLEPEDLVALWMRKNLDAFLAAARRGRAVSEASLLARLKRGLRSRGIDAWRAEYARRNPIPNYYWVRFGKVLRSSSSLVERDGFVTFRNRRFHPPGRAELVPVELVFPRPELPVMRSHRLRSSRGAEKLYLRWMEACLILAEGKLKRRVLAELLARAHGIPCVLPGYRGEAFDPDILVELYSAPDAELESDEPDPLG